MLPGGFLLSICKDTLVKFYSRQIREIMEEFILRTQKKTTSADKTA
jgi:hypothetical protein